MPRSSPACHSEPTEERRRCASARSVAWVLLCALAVLLCQPVAADSQSDPALRITRVDRLIVPVADRAMDFTLPDAGAAWSPAQLPDIVHKDKAGGRQLRWYRIRADYRGDPPVGLYSPRVVGGVDRWRFYVGGHQIDNARGGYGLSAWNRPEFVQIPRASLPARGEPVEILLGVLVDTRMGLGVAPVWVGFSPVVATKTADAEFVRLILPQAIALALLMLGALALAYWLVRQREPAYLLFALATAAWFVRTLYYWVDESPLPEDGDLWLHVNALTWVMALVYAYAFRLMQRRFGVVEGLLIGLIVAVGVLTVPGVFGNIVVATTLAYVLQAVIAVGVTVLITLGALRRRDVDVGVLAASLWLNLALGLHDLLLKEMLVDIERVFLLPYGGVAIFAAFLYAAQRRFLRAIEGIERSNVELELRVAERGAQLEQAFARLRGMERERARADERQRLMREMHDGLGSSLMSSLALVEQGRMDMPAVSQVLRECVDDLKLTMDSMEPIDGEVATLLATLRYRLGRRLEAAGLPLRWDVGDLPALPWLDSAASLQVLRIFQEALTNIVKHAQATSIAVTAQADADGIRVVIEDDGRGFSGDGAAAGRGLRNMRRRAEEIGAGIVIEPAAPGTRIVVLLPLKDARASGAA